MTFRSHGIIGVFLAAAFLAGILVSSLSPALSVDPVRVADLSPTASAGPATKPAAAIDEPPALVDLDSAASTLKSARQLRAAGQLEQAAALLSADLSRHSNNVDVLGELAEIRQQQGRTAEAIGYYYEIVRRKPDWNAATNNLAWLLATVPDDALRDGGRAGQLSLKLCLETKYKNADYLDTLAAAYAEVGRVPEAVQAIALAQQLSQKRPQSHRDELAARLAIYREGRPFRSPLPRAASVAADVDVEAIAFLGRAHESAGRLVEALECYTRAIEIRDAPLWVMQRAAWLMATHDHPSVRNPDRALALARRLNELTRHEDFESLTILSAALAVVGEEVEARTIAAQALQLPIAATESREATVMRSWLERFASSPGIPTEPTQIRREQLLIAWRNRLPRSAVAMKWMARLARILATHDDPRIRDPELATLLAANVVKNSAPHAVLADGLAAAHAAAGRFDEAVRIAQSAREQIASTNFERDFWSRRLRQFEQQTPLRESFDGSYDEPPFHKGSDPALAFALAIVARECKASHEPSIVVATWEAVLNADPQSAIAHRQLGITLAETGDPSSAAYHLLESLERNRDDAEVLGELGRVLTRTGNVGQAIYYYEQALARRPHWHDAANNLAWLLATQEDTSIRDARRAIELAKLACEVQGASKPMHLDTLATAYAADGQFDQAITIAFEAVRLLQEQGKQRETETIGRRLKLFTFGIAYIDLTTRPALSAKESDLEVAQLGQSAEDARRDGDWSKAIKHYVRILQRRPDWNDVANNLAWLLATAPDAAVRGPQRALRIAQCLCDPKARPRPLYFDTLGAACAATGDYEAARTATERARDLVRDTASAETLADLDHRIACYAKQTPWREPVVEREPAPDFGLRLLPTADNAAR